MVRFCAWAYPERSCCNPRLSVVAGIPFSLVIPDQPVPIRSATVRLKKHTKLYSPELNPCCLSLGIHLMEDSEKGILQHHTVSHLIQLTEICRNILQSQSAPRAKIRSKAVAI
jgi:hypothetical protein